MADRSPKNQSKKCESSVQKKKKRKMKLKEEN